MSTNPAHQKIRQFLTRKLLVDFGDGSTDDATDLFETGLVDSYGFVQLVAFLEKEFAIVVTEEESLSDQLTSFQKLCAYIDGKVLDAAR